MRVCPGCRTVYEEHIHICPKDGLPLIDRSPTFALIKEEESKAVEKTPVRKEETSITSGLMIGEYKVEGAIAEGGMGVIYAGIHPLISKRVAIKVLNKRFAQDPKAVSRFVLEARSVNEIGHHNIVDIFSIGELDDGRNYLIMELLDGLALHDIVFRAGRLEPSEVLAIYEQLCDALKAAHSKGFVHRDLKPDNIVVLRRPPFPFIKILDFGLAKLRGSATSTNTEVGTVLGTPEYMAPEQCRGIAVDARTDIYAMGVMLYELLTGRRPFTDPSPLRVLAMQQRDTPKPPSRYAPISDALEGIILKAISKDPRQRFSSVEDLLTHLAAAVPDRSPWTANLDPIEPTKPKPAMQGPRDAGRREMKNVPMGLPPRPGGFGVPEPEAISKEFPSPDAISDDLDDDELETLVQDSKPNLNLRELREKVKENEIHSGGPAVPAVRNVRLSPSEVRSPAPLLGTPASDELADMGATEISAPPVHIASGKAPIAAGIIEDKKTDTYNAIPEPKTTKIDRGARPPRGTEKGAPAPGGAPDKPRPDRNRKITHPPVPMDAAAPVRVKGDEPPLRHEGTIPMPMAAQLLPTDDDPTKTTETAVPSFALDPTEAALPDALAAAAAVEVGEPAESGESFDVDIDVEDLDAAMDRITSQESADVLVDTPPEELREKAHNESMIDLESGVYSVHLESGTKDGGATGGGGESPSDNQETTEMLAPGPHAGDWIREGLKRPQDRAEPEQPGLLFETADIDEDDVIPLASPPRLADTTTLAGDLDISPVSDQHWYTSTWLIVTLAGIAAGVIATTILLL